MHLISKGSLQLIYDRLVVETNKKAAAVDTLQFGKSKQKF